MLGHDGVVVERKDSSDDRPPGMSYCNALGLVGTLALAFAALGGVALGPLCTVFVSNISRSIMPRPICLDLLFVLLVMLPPDPPNVSKKEMSFDDNQESRFSDPRVDGVVTGDKLACDNLFACILGAKCDEGWTAGDLGCPAGMALGD